MKTTAWTLTLVITIPTFAAASQPPAATSQPGRDATAERGRYLTTISGCHDCHTPFHMTPEGPAPDMSRMLSGHPQQLEMPPAPVLPEGPWLMTGAATNTAWAGPWGVSFSANLTPDADTGIGAWTEDEFIGAMRTGRHRGRGRQILPPMPWPNMAQASDEDLHAIYAFLRTIPAIENRVPDPLPPAP